MSKIGLGQQKDSTCKIIFFDLDCAWTEAKEMKQDIQISVLGIQNAGSNPDKDNRNL